ncbi:hypothetical protein ABFS82_04G120600 [Erythranthe guttata]|uniref:SAM domain-containing protein n=1 Tax=Erythranthe guttata TaxID=4155 RepID=A0A022Q750_ERYGU|nr:PREDICTED: protein bicaudal C homolog 1-B-like [Erythranthe guttata]EYU24477.1 hypothetical protein MIMGU_mgv1a019732mg [Erythranthe guttata]|eukprot:XP_012852585.1 PREDICTED: protein bicaudal C homolog 1-B-like [Erythranthe guttata]
MQDGGGGGSGGGGVSTQEAAPTKRVRRPNVRLNQPYYVNAAHGRGPVQQRWDAFKKDLEGARKSKTLKTCNSKNGKLINAEGTKGSNLDNDDDDDDDDDDMVIGSWKNLNSSKRDSGFGSKSKRKRAGPSNFKKRLSSESINKKDEKFEVSNVSESENRRAEEEEEENSGANGAHMNLEVSFDNEKLTDGDNDYDGDNVVEKQGKLMSGDHDLVDGEEKNGVRVWLNELGLGKYANIFEFHEVDDAILPFLTFEDLKEMGIGAVGSRRKMYRSIQKLGQGFS